MIHRKKRDKNYTIIPNNVYAHHQLSWQAMGLLSYLLSKPDDWQVSPRALVKVTEESGKKTGINGIYTILRELKAAGFCTMQRLANGKTVYVIYDEPQSADANTQPQKLKQAKPRYEKPHKANDDVLLSNINKQKTDVYQNPPNPQRGNKGKWTLPKEINVQAWQDFEKHRTEKRKPLTNLARAKACQLLIKQTSEQQQAMVDQTIVNGWTGLFEIRSASNKQPMIKPSLCDVPQSYTPSPTAYSDIPWLDDVMGGFAHA